MPFRTGQFKYRFYEVCVKDMICVQDIRHSASANSQGKETFFKVGKHKIK